MEKSLSASSADGISLEKQVELLLCLIIRRNIYLHKYPTPWYIISMVLLIDPSLWF